MLSIVFWFENRYSNNNYNSQLSKMKMQSMRMENELYKKIERVENEKKDLIRQLEEQGDEPNKLVLPLHRNYPQDSFVRDAQIRLQTRRTTMDLRRVMELYKTTDEMYQKSIQSAKPEFGSR